MKRLLRSLLATVTLCLALAGCNKAPDEKTAIANFKADIETVGKWMDEKQKSKPADPLAAMGLMNEMVGKVRGIRTEGLPADLKTAWDETSVLFGEMAEIFKGMPTAESKNPADAMKALGEIVPKMTALQSKMNPASKKLEEVGKKYGLDLKKITANK
jgi:hypothetical protein